MKCKQNHVITLMIIMLCIVCFFPQKVAAQEADTSSADTSVVSETAVTETVDQGCVEKPKPVIILSKAKVSLERKEKTKLRASVKNSTGSKIIWKSNRKSVATVNKYGQISAKKSGKALITARISGTNITAKCVVTVEKYVTMRVRTTGYCNCRSCAGRWAGGPTALGTRPKENRTIAVDRRLIRLGTKVKIGNRMYVAEDTGGAIKGKRIDIYYASHRRATSHGVKYQNIKVYYYA